MSDSNFSFRNNNHCPLPFSQRDNPFLAQWIKKSVMGVFLLFISCMTLIKIFWKDESFPLQEKEESLVKKDHIQILKVPPVLVNFKSHQGIRTIQVSVQLETRYPSVKRKFAIDYKLLHKHLLLVLAGKEVQEVQNRKTYFEGKILSQMNAFLTKGTVEKITLHTKMLKQEG